jgi:hypothetical protein
MEEVWREEAGSAARIEAALRGTIWRREGTTPRFAAPS